MKTTPNRGVLVTLMALLVLTCVALIWLPASVAFIGGTAASWLWCWSLDRDEMAQRSAHPASVTSRAPTDM